MITVAHTIRPILWLGLALCLACAAPSPPQPGSDDPLVALIQQHPCDGGTETPAEVARALRTDDTYENELHDCQRLVDGGRYGPLVGLFPQDSVVRLAAFPAGGAVVAALYNWGDWKYRDRAYDPLRIPPRLSCLWLERADGGDWSAVLLAPEIAGCAGASPSTSPVIFDELDVHAVAAPGGAAMPASARWDWDADRGEHLIGVRCGRSWCYVGRTGFQAPTVSQTPGLYDRQHVAVRPSLRLPWTPPLRPGPLATIEPAPGLADLTFDQFQTAASIVVEGRGWQRYQRKLFLEASEDGTQGAVDIMLRRVRNGFQGLYRQPASRDTASALGVDFTADVKHGAIGAARWRWQRDDEKAWISCTNGCCDVDRSARVQ